MGLSKYSRAAACETANQLARWLQIRYHGAQIHVFGELVRNGAWHPRGMIRFALGGIHCDPMEIEHAARERGLDFSVGFFLFGENQFADEISSKDWIALEAQAVKLPGGIPESGSEPEIIALAQELQELPRAMKSVKEASDVLDESLRLSIFAGQADHYRTCFLEPLLSKILGMIDGLPFLEDALADRLNLYRVASLEVEGKRPRILPPEVAAWHARYAENHESLLTEEESLTSSKEQVKTFQEMERRTTEALAAFGWFLAERQSDPQKIEE